jgi:hypothetical protein
VTSPASGYFASGAAVEAGGASLIPLVTQEKKTQRKPQERQILVGSHTIHRHAFPSLTRELPAATYRATTNELDRLKFPLGAPRHASRQLRVVMERSANDQRTAEVPLEADRSANRIARSKGASSGSPCVAKMRAPCADRVPEISRQ